MANASKKLIVSLIAGGLVVGALVAPALAGKKAKPVKTTLYMHGNEVIGELESTNNVADAPLPMDPTEPTGTEPKSHGIFNGVVTPNHRCANNYLFAAFAGDVNGRIVGDMKITLHAIATPGKVDVRVWTDKLGLLCTSEVAGTADYPEPAAEATVDLPAGHGVIEAVFEDLDVLATTNLVIQVSPETMAAGPEEIMPPFVARVLYDTPDLASSVEFECIPAKGQKSCTP